MLSYSSFWEMLSILHAAPGMQTVFIHLGPMTVERLFREEAVIWNQSRYSTRIPHVSEKWYVRTLKLLERAQTVTAHMKQFPRHFRSISKRCLPAARLPILFNQALQQHGDRDLLFTFDHRKFEHHRSLHHPQSSHRLSIQAFALWVTICGCARSFPLWLSIPEIVWPRYGFMQRLRISSQLRGCDGLIDVIGHHHTFEAIRIPSSSFHYLRFFDFVVG